MILLKLTTAILTSIFKITRPAALLTISVEPHEVKEGGKMEGSPSPTPPHPNFYVQRPIGRTSHPSSKFWNLRLWSPLRQANDVRPKTTMPGQDEGGRGRWPLLTFTPITHPCSEKKRPETRGGGRRVMERKSCWGVGVGVNKTVRKMI